MNASAPVRELRLVPASSIAPRPVKWLDEGRIPLGALTLVGGREGIGKSTLAYWIAAQVTRGKLVGLYEGKPRGVIVAATEDSWSQTIVPRLMGAGADLERVYRVDVTQDGADSFLSLPADLEGVEELIRDHQIALVILDPLLSRLDARLDTHKDAQVRQALEPLVAVTERTLAAVLGLIHVSKVTTTDPMTSLMASRAFAAVARAVVYMISDPDDPAIRLVGTPKENLGRSDLPTRACRIEGVKVADTAEGEVWTARLVWTGERLETVQEILEAQGDGADVRTALADAATWLRDFLTLAGGSAESSTITTAGRRDSHNPRTLRRAAQRLRVTITSEGFPRRTTWALPIPHRPQSGQILSSRPTVPIVPTDSQASQDSKDNQASKDSQDKSDGHVPDVARLRQQAALHEGRR